MLNGQSLDYYHGSKNFWRKSLGPSKLSLEVLACGTLVVWKGLTLEPNLPERHKSGDVAKKTIEIYEEILR